MAKGEIGLGHYEGRNYTGLLRHLMLCLVVMGFVLAGRTGFGGKNPEVTLEQVCRR